MATTLALTMEAFSWKVFCLMTVLQTILKNSSRSHPPIFSLLHPICLSIRETVESLTETPQARRRNWRLPGKVAADRSWRSASKSFLAASSSLGFEPGRFLGAKDRPALAVAT